MADLTKTDDRPADGADPGADDQRQCEWLAAGALLVVTAIVLRGYLQAWTLRRIDGLSFDRSLTGWRLVELAAAGSTNALGGVGGGVVIVTSLALVTTYVLILVVGPGEEVSGFGIRVLQALAGVAAVVTLNALVTVQAVLRYGGELTSTFDGPSGFGGPEIDSTTRTIDRVASALPALAGLVVAALVTVLTVRWLLPDGDEVGPDDDAPTADVGRVEAPYTDPYGFDPASPSDPT